MFNESYRLGLGTQRMPHRHHHKIIPPAKFAGRIVLRWSPGHTYKRLGLGTQCMLHRHDL